MSSKKIYTTLGLSPEVLSRIQEEAQAEQRARGFVVERILREYFKIPWGQEKESTSANHS